MLRRSALAYLKRALAVATVLACGPAAAAEASLTVTRGGPPSDTSCPDTYTLVQRVRAQRPTGLSFGSGTAAPRIEVTFMRRPDGALSAQVRAGGPIAGERTLFDNGTGCAALGEAVAVTVALLLDGTTSPEPEPMVAPTKEHAASTGQLLLSGGLTTNSVAALAPRFGAEIVIHAFGRPRARSLEVGGAVGYVPAAASRLGIGEISSSAAFGSVRLGIRFGIGSISARTQATAFAFIPSVVASAGSVRAEGSGYLDDRANSRAFATLGLAVPFAWEPSSGLVVRLSPSVDVATRQQRFVVSNVTGHVDLPLLSATLVAAVGLTLF